MDPTSDPTPFLRGLYHPVPPDRIAHTLESAGRRSARVRRIPADAAARLVIALGLFADLSIPHVWRRRHPGADAPDPVESAFARARVRPGVRPVRELFGPLARPLATHQTVGADYRGSGRMAIDGTTLDRPDTAGNARAFGRPGADRLVVAHYLIRRVIHEAAVTGSVDPDRVSCTGTLRVLWCRRPGALGAPRPTGTVTSCGRSGGSGFDRDVNAGTHVWSSGRCRTGTRSGRSTSTRLSRPNPSGNQYLCFTEGY